MKTYTNVPGQSTPFNTQPGQRRLAQPAPKQYQAPAVQQHFQDVQRAQGQQAAVDFGRQGTQAAADYSLKANQAQNAAVLGGLAMLGEQRQDAYQRSQAQQDMAYGWMNDIFGAGRGMLGGLL